MPLVLPPADPLQPPSLGVVARARVVQVKDIAFTPSRLTVRRGSSVTWRFLDGPTFHNVRFLTRRKVKGSRDSRTGSFTTRFRTPGRYRYHCTLHPLVMKGVVVVAR
jgi:plastocyanin